MTRPQSDVRFASSWFLSWFLLPSFIGFLFDRQPEPVPMPFSGEGCTTAAPTVEIPVRDANEMPVTDFTVSGICCNAFSFSGLATGNNPTLTLTRGVTYTFTLTTGGAHPFTVRATAGGANLAGPFSADFSFTPDFVMPSNMVYQCFFHAPMLGNIVLINPGTPPNATNMSAAETYTEDAALNLTDIVVSDVDNTTTTATLTLSNPAAGSLNTGTSGAVTSTYIAGTGVWSASGAIANVNTLLAGLTYTPAANFNSAFTIATSVTDGSTAPITGSKPMTGTAVNDAPTLGSAALASQNEDVANPPGGSVSTIFTGQFADIDAGSSFSGIAVLGNTASAITQGVWQYSTNAGTNWFNIGTVNAVAALTLSSGTLVRFVPVLNFNGSPAVLSVRGMDNTYAGAFSTTAGTETRVTVSTASTGGSTPIATAVASLSTTITAVNDAPAATNLNAAENYTEEVSLNLVDIVASDVDNATLTATLTLSTTAAGSLSTATSGAVTSTFSAGVWSASGATANVNTLLAGVVFTPAANFSSNFTITTSVSDGIAAPATGSKNMTGTNVNDAPSATNLNAAESYTEDVSLNLTDIVASDVDNATLSATLTLSNTAAGSLSTATSGAVTATFSAGVWSASGAIANVNTLLAGVVFTPAANFNSSFTITTSVSDGIAAPATGSKSMTGTAVNDAPTATNLNAAESYTEDLPLDLTDIVVSDVDHATTTATLTLSNTAAGSLSTATSGAVTSTFSAGVWSASGATANVNTLLAGAVFTPAVNFSSGFTITTSVSDGIAAPATGSKSMTGTAVNDAPTATNLNAAESYTEDLPLDLTDIVVSDVDHATTTATLTLSNTAAGSLNTATSGAVTSTYNSGTGEWTASGAIADVNTLLADLAFTPTPDFNGNFTITTNLSDGIAAPATGSKAITGSAVNDAPTATNLNAAETYTTNTPLDLIDMVVNDVDHTTTTVSLSLSNTTAGSLNTATSGTVTSTFNSGTGVWTASGAIADVNTLLAGLTFTPATNFSSNFTMATSVSDGIAAPASGSKSMNGSGAPVISIIVHVVLEGSYNAGTGLMNGALRTAGLVPLTEPYTALGYTYVGTTGGSTTPAVLAVGGADAVHDWVIVELRSAADPAVIVYSRAALIQRDGQVCDFDGVSPMTFTMPPDNYYLAVRHRNHLGAMTAAAIGYTATPSFLDMAAIGFPCYGTEAQKTITGSFATQALWAGDVTFDRVLKYTGANNDRDPILVAIGGTVPTNTVSGYLPADVNLDGVVKYTGASNDRDPILVNIGGTVPTNTRVEQIP